jgi:predicted transposase YbfD/YdcC
MQHMLPLVQRGLGWRVVRTHRHIENRLHWPRDVTLGEDACQARSGQEP